MHLHFATSNNEQIISGRQSYQKVSGQADSDNFCIFNTF